jgi:hypothetical protein
MATNAMRVFEDRPAVREATPLLIGLQGPSGSGKTYSALRLATGIQRVVGGEIYGIDTESRRMLHYADKFDFRHLPFGAPFSPLDYLAAIEHCVKRGAKTIIIDSMSHEHEGPGGVLEMHEAEVQRMSGGDRGKAERVKMLAWSRPKQQRRRLLNTLMQINANIILCFRAKEKLKIVPGKEPEQLGWMPIGGDEFVFEMTLCCLLPPGARGIPVWESQFPGERAMMKLPGQFEQLFGEPRELDEDTGLKLAHWSAGTAPQSAPTVDDYESCSSEVAFEALEKRRADAWRSTPARQKTLLKAASDAARKRVAETGAPSVSRSLELLRECSDLETIDTAWDNILEQHDELNLAVPVEIEAAYKERRELLSEQER